MKVKQSSWKDKKHGPGSGILKTKRKRFVIYLSHSSSTFEQVNVIGAGVAGVAPREDDNLAVTVERQERLELRRRTSYRALKIL